MAKESLIGFSRYTFPQYQPAPHHDMIAEKLEAVARGEIKRLRIHMPPRHGKSELASKRFPAFFMGRYPTRHVIAASYNSDLAADFGREVRNIVGSPRYRAVFDTTLAEDSSAANRWHTNEGGMYAAVGIGTATTGRGAHVFLIDDPFKDREEADSQNQREKVWRWYTSTAYTRLESDIRRGDITEDDELWHDLLDDIGEGKAEPFEGAIVLICTRWHEDDLAGRLEASQSNDGEEWETLDLPAILSDGRALWSAKYPIERLHKIRATIGERDWSALYQQRPTPDEGDYFRREWFKFYNTKPNHLRTYGASDYAVTAKGGDYTVHVVAGVDPDDNLYILDIWRSQAESHVWVETFIDMIHQHKPLNWYEEQGQIIKSLGPFIDKRMRERKVYCRREQVSSVADKPTRARSFQARAAMGKVYLPHNAPWAADLMSELLTFPAGKHDDQVDTLGLIGRMLDTMVGGRVPREAPKEKSRWDRAFERRQGENSSWKTL
jgi:predicted phage terminase large subunit-like protein